MIFLLRTGETLISFGKFCGKQKTKERLYTADANFPSLFPLKIR